MAYNIMLLAVWPYFLTGILCIIGGAAIGLILNNLLLKSKINKNKEKARRIIEDAYNETKTIKNTTLLKAQEEILQLKSQSNIEILNKSAELQREKDRLDFNKEQFSKELLDLEKQKNNINETKIKLEKNENEYLEKQAEITTKLESISQLNKDEAKKELIAAIEDDAKKEAAKTVREIEYNAREDADKKAKEIVAGAIQRVAVDQANEVTVSVVSIPSDDVKGRIIGREGRNIRALESATGVDVIIDDTPESITLSSFDPIRREIARISLEKLILDGRIHPARIEEIVDKVKRDIEVSMKEAGELAVEEAGIVNLHPELVKVLGRLKYRTSYGQNVLKHSLEVCLLSGLMAAEIGVNVQIAKRGGLLHDIGKGLDFEQEGTHVQIGVDLARKYRENESVIHCIEAHHGNVEYKSIEAVLVQAADAISSSRPGARRESLESYIKRLKQLEEIANSFKGVDKSYAIQAGREIRIIVKPEEIDDNKAIFMAKDIAKKIESEMEYPGQIKVNVIRETRNSEYAK